MAARPNSRPRFLGRFGSSSEETFGTNGTTGFVGRRPRVLLSTEGTYPYIVGGVSTWCDALVSGLEGVDFGVLAITAGGLVRRPMFPKRPNMVALAHLDLWSEDVPVGRPSLRSHATDESIPARLAEGLLGWNSNTAEFLDALVWCRRNDRLIRNTFRSRRAWARFLTTFESILASDVREAPTHPAFSMQATAELYQLLFWIAQTAAFPTPTDADAPDLLLTTAAGWASIPAVVHKSLHGTPLSLTEHGVYIREAYLAAIRSDDDDAKRWISTRVARGLARLSYAYADVIAPVTEANRAWEEAFGVPPERIRVIYNGVVVPPEMTLAPRGKIVVTIGRIDPLKDLKTMLRCAAEVVAEDPGVTFCHFGPVPLENTTYYNECLAVKDDLGLGDRFQFMGSTDDPFGVLAAADVFLLSSISEGSPITVLEAMASGRPVVATAVGGVSEAVRGCGFTARPGDHQALAAGVLRLIEDPDLAAALGARAYARASTVFGQSTCLENYRLLIGELTGLDVAPVHAAVATESPDVLTEDGALPEVGDHDMHTSGVLPSGAAQSASARSGNVR